ncbi:SIR2 family protein [Wenyingzhuangia aestuarii]|uniref:SIR2 family protein n=1 Tax=Wenyingzhuangia aestuarii TaxID=1647582 RepID=UPI00143C0792|nr:SIR2 family protein [Wenyingzhuangia aestuarii]NJB84187.1 hypothetical protein [Wenyingzhuangia aestuarii]
MKKQTEVFLFGAGAMINWNGPLTSELTELVRNSGFPIKNSKTKITEFIYNRLIENGYSSDEVNFETIINVIEELSVYYSEHNKTNKTPSILRSFLKENELDVILNFSIKDKERKHGYLLDIPSGSNYIFSKHSYQNENPKQYFLQHLLALIITELNSVISKYAYHTEGNSVINKESKCSVNFKQWMSSIEKNSFIRMYTLNYDRIFKILLEDINIKCFEGYHATNSIDDMKGLRADVPKILNDFECNIQYNLHGSAFWKVKPLDKGGLPNPEILFSGIPELSVNDDQVSIQMEKGKPIYITNIITGYQKAQKGSLTPFKQMQSAFDKDTCNAKKIYIIGYSFGDEHINESIRTALRYNKELYLEIVDPSFIKNKLDEKLNITLFQSVENDIFYPTQISENKFSYFNDKVILHTLTFEEYLNQKCSS